MLKKILICTALFCVSPLLFAFTETELVQQLQQAKNVQGDFSQQRFLKSLAKPITSRGEFTLVENKGLLWQMKTPFANTLRVKPDGIQQWNGNQWVGNAKLGQSEQIGLFLGLLSGDISGLKSQFDLQLTGNSTQWQLRLVPNSILMKQIFNEITLQGDEQVKQIELVETQGDKTQILFENIKANQALTDFAKTALE